MILLLLLLALAGISLAWAHHHLSRAFTPEAAHGLVLLVLALIFALSAVLIIT